MAAVAVGLSSRYAPAVDVDVSDGGGQVVEVALGLGVVPHRVHGQIVDAVTRGTCV